MTATVSLCGVDVPRIGFGTLYITRQRGFGPARPDAVALLREAAAFGVRLFDTADSYGNGAAEEAVRAALHPYDGLVIATKGGFHHERLGAWRADARPEHLRAALDASLSRLGVERIGLYQLHCADPRVPYEDSIGTLADLQRAGKIAHIGISNVSLRELAIALRAVTVVSVQNAYNIRSRWDTDVLDECERAGIAFLPWMPLGDGSISWHDRSLTRIAGKHGATPPQIALAALLHRAPAILPIPGTSNSAHLHENVTASDIALDAEDLAALWPDWRRT